MRGRLGPCRGDAGFALLAVYVFLETEGFGYAICLSAKTILQDNVVYLLKRPVGRPPKEARRYCATFSYRATSCAALGCHLLQSARRSRTAQQGGKHAIRWVATFLQLVRPQ
jgi:hypothetical protein